MNTKLTARGFTLIEMLVATLCMLIIGAGTYALLRTGYDSQWMLMNQNNANMGARTGVDTMADKMRGVDRVNFHSVDLAWEAHRIRNRIAHEGDAHQLSAREARRVIALYERVFKEFRFIE